MRSHLGKVSKMGLGQVRDMIERRDEGMLCQSRRLVTL